MSALNTATRRWHERRAGRIARDKLQLGVVASTLRSAEQEHAVAAAPLCASSHTERCPAAPHVVASVPSARPRWLQQRRSPASASPLLTLAHPTTARPLLSSSRSLSPRCEEGDTDWDAAMKKLRERQAEQRRRSPTTLRKQNSRRRRSNSRSRRRRRRRQQQRRQVAASALTPATTSQLTQRASMSATKSI